uniref:CCHC-type domain-containing protein n=1 Tax=Cajanus cajan TaxID=3821 RepID=A0A151UD28_CAJCA
MKVEQLFACHRVSEERKVPLATLSFQGHAMYWWTSLERERRLHNDPPIQYWNDLRSALRRRHIPSYYGRELMNKLQRLQQKDMTVEQYRQQMELYMMRACIREEEATTVARFLSGLNLEIRDQVELLPYRDLNDLVQLCVRVEQQMLRKSSKRESSHSRSLKKDYMEEEKPFEKKIISEPSKELAKRKEKNKDKDKDLITPHTSTKTSDIKCFKCLGRGHIASQCPTKKVMILRGHDTYSSQEETTTSSSSESEVETKLQRSKVEPVYPYEGELLMLRRILHNQPSGTLSQRENIFHTRCNVLNNACSLIVDSVVDQQVKVKFSIGKYEDQALCDIVPMEACHILLGRPWKFEKKTVHDGLTNEITFTHKEKKFVLHPLSPQQVAEDQTQMKIKRKSEKVGKSKEEEISSKGVISKENCFITKEPMKTILFIHIDLNSYPHAATSLKEEVNKSIIFKEKESQLQDFVKEKWTSLSSTSHATSLLVPKVDSLFLCRNCPTLVMSIMHPIYGIYYLLDITSEPSRFFVTNSFHNYPTNNIIQNCLGNFLVVFFLFSRKCLGYHIGYFRQDILVFRIKSLVCYSFSFSTFLGFRNIPSLCLGEDPIHYISRSSIIDFFRFHERIPSRIFLSHLFVENITSDEFYYIFVGMANNHEDPRDFRSNPFQEGGDDRLWPRPRNPRRDILKEPRGMG